MAQSEHISHAGEHQQGGKQEEEVAEEHHTAQTADDEVRTFIALQELHRREAEGTYGEDIGSRLPGQHTDSSPHHHQQGSH